MVACRVMCSYLIPIHVFPYMYGPVCIPIHVFPHIFAWLPLGFMLLCQFWL